MESTTLTWEQTLAALLPLIGQRLLATTPFDDFQASAFAARRERVGVESAPVSGVDQA